jgi:hypothetical protein
VRKKESPRPCGRGLGNYGLTSCPDRQKIKREAYCVEAVVFAAFVFFVFVAFVFFAFVVVSCAPAAVANTGIASENAITKVNSSVKSFFMLGLDLLKNYFHLFR